MTPLRSAHVRVPCSTSNLGSGFDTLGLALGRYLEARYTPGDDALELVRSGTLAEVGGSPGDDLLLRAFLARMAEAGVDAGGVVTVGSEIPVGRGLGSSGAALVGGWALGGAALGRPTDLQGAWIHAATVEGHGDNAAPCAFGGLRAVVDTARGPRAVPLELSSRVGFAYAAPATPMSTRDAREVLPPTVDHATAVRGLGRLAALLQGLATADPELCHIGLEDELHVPYRLRLIPDAYDAMAAARAAGAWGVTISGSGSGLLALCAPSDATEVARAMHQVFAVEDGGPGCVGFPIEPDLVGTVQMPK